jgi:hypothetical protein
MTAHREWAASWEFADDLGDEELVTREGVSPFGRIAVEAAVEGLTRVATWSGGGRTTREDQLPVMERFAVDALSALRCPIGQSLLGFTAEFHVGRPSEEP